jgi:hypothetical protein
MVEKHPICPQRVRKVPKQFSWIDQRLVRERHIDRLSHGASALYLFLVTVADAKGISYYSDRTIGKRLSMDAHILATVRGELVENRLIAYKHPLYQVLAVEDHRRHGSGGLDRRHPSEPMLIKQIFTQIAKGA